MIRDPLTKLQSTLQSFLADRVEHDSVLIDAAISKDIPWRPHLLETYALKGWYIHSHIPSSHSWAERIQRSVRMKPKLRVGVAVQEDLLLDEEFLDICHQVNASVIVYREQRDSFSIISFHNSVDDLIYENELILSREAARQILDRDLARALNEADRNQKGVLLELLVAVLMSQVDGFQVTDVGISNRTQQMDVMVQNRNVGGALGGSAIVLAEAKNWADPVGTDEYASFIRKLQSRHGRAKLGYLITAGRFTSGVALERRRDSNEDTLVVLVDRRTLPGIWQSDGSITQQVERLTIQAAVGT